MDNNSLLCVIEILGTILIAVAAVVIRNWASIRKSIERMRETTHANRPQWVSILAGILGVNLGYILLVGIFSLIMWLDDSNAAETFWIPVATNAYLFCTIPTYLPVGVICGLRIYRFTQRKAMESRKGFIIALAVSTFLGAIIGIPLYILCLMGAAL